MTARDPEAHKKYQLEHITDKELENRANLPEDEWVELPPSVSIVDYYKHLLRDKVVEDKKTISPERKQRLKNFINGFENESNVNTDRLCKEIRGKKCEENDEKGNDTDQ